MVCDEVGMVCDEVGMVCDKVEMAVADPGFLEGGV